MIFPCEQEFVTPTDLIPKMSQVACVLQCGGIWIGGKGWGLTWKLNQCIVKPREIVSVYGKCQVRLSAEECQVIETQEIKEDVDDSEQYVSKGVVGGVELKRPAPSQSKNDTYAEDSDDEKELPVTQEIAPTPVQEEQQQEPEPEPEPVEAKPVKKIVKKAVVPAPEPEQEPAEAPKKKVVKKKV
jgi:hypothetical protein